MIHQALTGASAKASTDTLSRTADRPMTEPEHTPEADATAVIRERVPLGPVVSHRCAFTVIDGPDVGLTVRLDECTARRVFVGSGPVCDVRLNDKTVSRRHAALEISGNTVRLTDLESSNGTIVNGVLVREVMLRGGETI